jgi:hypothetical protein
MYAEGQGTGNFATFFEISPGSRHCKTFFTPRSRPLLLCTQPEMLASPSRSFRQHTTTALQRSLANFQTLFSCLPSRESGLVRIAFGRGVWMALGSSAGTDKWRGS